MALLVDAVFMNAGSSVTKPVWARSFADVDRALVLGPDDHRQLQDLVLNFQLGGQSVLRRVLGHVLLLGLGASITYILDA